MSYSDNSDDFSESDYQDGELPSSIDWRERRAVTRVRSQGNCGSCWAFAVVGALEGQHFLKTGQLKELSVQNLMDCSISIGCDGSNLQHTYQYLMHYTIPRENAYPYLAHDEYCKYRPKHSSGMIHKFKTIPQGNEYLLQKAIATVGPISVSMDASSDLFTHFYGDTIYRDQNCGSDSLKLDHAVLVVGYGTDEDGNDYYICKNSYGATMAILNCLAMKIITVV